MPCDRQGVGGVWIAATSFFFSIRPCGCNHAASLDNSPEPSVGIPASKQGAFLTLLGTSISVQAALLTDRTSTGTDQLVLVPVAPPVPDVAAR